MKKKITTALYLVLILGIIIRLWMDIVGIRELDALNFSLLIALALIVSVIFSEIVFDKPSKKEKERNGNNSF